MAKIIIFQITLEKVLMGLTYNEMADVFSYGIVLIEIVLREKISKKIRVLI